MAGHAAARAHPRARAADHRHASPPVGPRGPPLPADRLPRRRRDRPQPGRHRVPRMPLDVPRGRARGDAPGGRDRVRGRPGRDERQRHVRADARRGRHRGLRRPDAGRPRGAGAAGASPRRRRALPRGAPLGGVGRERLSSATARWPTGRTSTSGPTSGRASRVLTRPRALARRLGLPSPARGRGGPGARVSRHHDHPGPRGRRCSATAPTPASRRRCSWPGRRR